MAALADGGECLGTRSAELGSMLDPLRSAPARADVLSSEVRAEQGRVYKAMRDGTIASAKGTALIWALDRMRATVRDEMETEKLEQLRADVEQLMRETQG